MVNLDVMELKGVLEGPKFYLAANKEQKLYLRLGCDRNLYCIVVIQCIWRQDLSGVAQRFTCMAWVHLLQN